MQPGRLRPRRSRFTLNCEAIVFVDQFAAEHRIRAPNAVKRNLRERAPEGGSEMEADVGDGIVLESERVGQPAHTGVVEEVLQKQPPRYRVRWEDGHESIVTPAAGAARIEPKKQPAKR
jgi:hypothetical protein